MRDDFLLLEDTENGISVLYDKRDKMYYAYNVIIPDNMVKSFHTPKEIILRYHTLTSFIKKGRGEVTISKMERVKKEFLDFLEKEYK